MSEGRTPDRETPGEKGGLQKGKEQRELYFLLRQKVKLQRAQQGEWLEELQAKGTACAKEQV